MRGPPLRRLLARSAPLRGSSWPFARLSVVNSSVCVLRNACSGTRVMRRRCARSWVRSRPCRVSALADRLGIRSPALRRADPSLYAKPCLLRSDRLAASRRAREAAARERARASSDLRSSLRRILEREIESASPCSLRAVAAEAGTAASVIGRHWPDLRERREAVRAKFLEDVRVQLEAEIALPQPRSPHAFALACSISPSALERAFPSLFADLHSAFRRGPVSRAGPSLVPAIMAARRKMSRFPRPSRGSPLRRSSSPFARATLGPLLS